MAAASLQDKKATLLRLREMIFGRKSEKRKKADPESDKDEEKMERETWLHFSAQGLAAAYDDDEPEYPVTLVKERNPESPCANV